jgi:uncharacterized membrane protein YhaH (DUF805 family)
MKNRKNYIVPVVIVAITSLVFLGYGTIVLSVIDTFSRPLLFRIVAIAAILALMGALVAVLIQRLKEIKEEDEDDISKY